MDSNNKSFLKKQWSYDSVVRPSHSVGLLTDGSVAKAFQDGKRALLITSIGPQYSLYESPNLNLVMRSPLLNAQQTSNPFIIHAIAADLKQNIIYAASGNTIFAFHRFDQLFTLKGQESNITELLLIGDLLISSSGNDIIIWSLSAYNFSKNRYKGLSTPPYEVLLTLPKNSLASSERIFSILHPPTYINKLIIAYIPSRFEIWNFKTKRKVYELQCFPKKFLNSNITAAILNESHSDMLAVAYECGKIFIIDIKRDEILLEFTQSLHLGKITRLLFWDNSSHTHDEKSLLLTSTSDGHIVQWDLNNGSLKSFHEGAHSSKIICLSLIISHNVILTVGTDNAIKLWTFDSFNSEFYLVKSRCGQPRPINNFDFYGNDMLTLLTSSSDNKVGYLGLTSLIQQQQNIIFSKKNAPKNLFSHANKIPPINKMAFIYLRHYDWPNIVTCHKGFHQCLIWSGFSRTLTPTTLSLTGHKPIATALSISPCGNIVCVGYEDGKIARYNLQSQELRGNFVNSDNTNKNAHNYAVSQLEFTHSSLLLSTSKHPKEASLFAWVIDNYSLSYSIDLESSGHGIDTFITSGALVSIALQNGNIIICDLISRSAIRTFYFNSAINSMTFGMDGRLFFVATKESEILCYDMFSSSLIDWLKLPSSALCIKFQNMTQQLISSHQDLQGLLVWNIQYDITFNSNNHLQQPSEPIEINWAFKPIKNLDSKPNSSIDSITTNEYQKKPPTQITKRALTLSGLNSTKTSTTLNLNQIKEQSRIQTHTLVAKEAPFFLNFSTLKFATGEANAIATRTPEKEIHNTSKESQLQQLLSKLDAKNCEIISNEILQFMKKQSPSAVHFEISTLASISNGEYDQLVRMLKCFISLVRTRQDADLVQIYLQIFINTYASILANEEFLGIAADYIEALRNLIYEDWRLYDLKFYKICCNLKFMTHLQLE